MRHPPELSPGHFGLEPEDLECHFGTGTLCASPIASLREILRQLRHTYCRTIGAEYMPIRDYAQRRWLQEQMERSWNDPQLPSEQQLHILTWLTQAEQFEKFLHTQFVGQKRFSLEGSESLNVILNGIVEEAARLDVSEIVLGMPHRGRLNTLVNVMEQDPQRIFAGFDDSEELNTLTGSGDVKYHKGYSSDVTREGKRVHLSLTFNPSHLEAVNPVVEGNVRARQDRLGGDAQGAILPVLVHGDAAFAGQGLVMETLNLSQLEGYRTGGTVHIIVNNQIGFTTAPEDARSMLYASDTCKMLNVPVLHVNGDDPEAVLHVTRLAMGFRQRFRTDIVIDLYCYRRLGHNEGDEPSFTQPALYEKIRQHPSTQQYYRKELERSGRCSAEQAEAIHNAYRQRLGQAREAERKNGASVLPDTLGSAWKGMRRGCDAEDHTPPPIPQERLRTIGTALASTPEDFQPHPRLKRILEARRAMTHGEQPLDWGMGELLAYGNLLYENYHVRMSGQDCRRGTFSHRHASLVDVKHGTSYQALQNLSGAQGRFSIFDSPLSEAGVLGFEFGYSLADPSCLVIWEAQFGDFANGAQVIIDQFLASSEAKWLRMSGLTLLLPHGFEGQGPEHSSAKLERFLQLCAEENMQVTQVTTPAQFFHLIRRQMQRSFRKPLIQMAPKSLLRHAEAVSSMEELSQGCFHETLPDPHPPTAQRVRRLIFCSGKVFYNLAEQRRKQGIQDCALIRIEQLYPLPKADLLKHLALYAQAQELLWVQEEPENMGPWRYMEAQLRELLPAGRSLRYVGRKASASPATGSHRVHQQEQEHILRKALQS